MFHMKSLSICIVTQRHKEIFPLWKARHICLLLNLFIWVSVKGKCKPGGKSIFWEKNLLSVAAKPE